MQYNPNILMVKGNEAVDLYASLVRQFGSAPEPVCRQCKIRKVTGYMVIPWDQETRKKMWFLGICPGFEWVVYDERALLKITICEDCVGFNDGYRCRPNDPDITWNEKEKTNYSIGYRRGVAYYNSLHPVIESSRDQIRNSIRKERGDLGRMPL